MAHDKKYSERRRRKIKLFRSVSKIIKDKFN